MVHLFLLYLLDLGETMRLVVVLLGKCSVSASYAVIYLYSAELFPTENRYIVNLQSLKWYEGIYTIEGTAQGMV